jgi:hypothetical protein
MAMTTNDITEADRAALQLALDLCLAGDPEGPGRADQVRDFLRGYGNESPRPWLDVAEFCSDCQQHARLDIFVSALSPCMLTEAEVDEILAKGPNYALNGSGIDMSSCPSAKLFKLMLKAGVSKYHPNPIAALRAKGRL